MQKSAESNISYISRFIFYNVRGVCLYVKQAEHPEDRKEQNCKDLIESTNEIYLICSCVLFKTVPVLC